MDYYNNSCFLDSCCSYFKFNTISNLKLKSNIQLIPQIGEKYSKLLNKLGIYVISDLLTFYPKNYHDFSKIYKIDELDDDVKTFKATVVKFSNTRTRKRNFTIQKAVVKDNNSYIDIIWFNQPFLETSIKTGKTYLFSGKLDPKNYKPQIISPEFEQIKKTQTHLGRISPIYHLTKGISNKWLRSRIHWLIDHIEYIEDLTETLDPRIIKKYDLLGIKNTVINIHFPTSKELLKKAKYRLAFEELLHIQIQLTKNKSFLKQFKTDIIKTNQKDLKILKKQFGYKLTDDQEQAIENIKIKLNSPKPTNILLSGDVGSGKTIVAIASALFTAKSGYQTAIIAPTTVLAEQHYKTFIKLLKPFNLKITLITNATKKSEINGKNNIIIGTHAVLFKKRELFNNLNLVIIDEQHRFGVEQRQELRKTFSNIKTKKTINFLMMTATPIPRTLALTLFNDLDVIQIKQKPLQRKETKTFLVSEKKRQDALKWIKTQAKKGIQIFWVAPLIEESEKLDTKSVETLYKELKDKLTNLNIEFLHGKLTTKEKNKILEKFKNFKKNKIHILVSTSVIEVGIDIPNANIIVIEGAERFGLAQLHQLRGRVGRSDQKSWCLLFTSHPPSKEQKERLTYFSKVTDGFKLSEFDLNLRGPGEVYGLKQSGIPLLQFAKLTDMNLIEKTKEAVNLYY